MGADHTEAEWRDASRVTRRVPKTPPQPGGGRPLPTIAHLDVRCEGHRNAHPGVRPIPGVDQPPRCSVKGVQHQPQRVTRDEAHEQDGHRPRARDRHKPPDQVAAHRAPGHRAPAPDWLSSPPRFWKARRGSPAPALTQCPSPTSRMPSATRPRARSDARADRTTRRAAQTQGERDTEGELDEVRESDPRPHQHRYRRCTQACR
jgi:hypothetical protein